MRLIRYDDAIERLGAHLMANAQIDWGGTASTDIEDWKELADMILNGAPTIDAVSVEWIPCEERLPNRQGHYICTCKDGSKYKRTTTVKWSNGWQLTGSRAYWIVLAWMPLPEPWKGADDE